MSDSPPPRCTTRGEAHLSAHPDTPGAPIAAFNVHWTADSQGIALSFRLVGQIDRVALPAPVRPGPADRLWEHTCCEAFVATEGVNGYREFNFAPSHQWAIYDFSAYRQPAHAAPHSALSIDFQRSSSALTLAVTIPWALLPGSVGDTLVIGLSGVIEDTDGNRSYWALAHPGSRPDFHHRDAFILAIPRTCAL